MPNGYSGPVEEWERMEAPLLEIDDRLAEFATERGIRVEKDYHNWPRRDLDWVGDGIHRSISILAANRPETYHVAITAWEDKNNTRYSADKWLKKWVPWTEIEDNLQLLLEEGFQTVNSWSEENLKPAP